MPLLQQCDVETQVITLVQIAGCQWSRSSCLWCLAAIWSSDSWTSKWTRCRLVTVTVKFGQLVSERWATAAIGEGLIMCQLCQQSTNGVNMSALLQILKLCDSALNQTEQTFKVSHCLYECVFTKWTLLYSFLSTELSTRIISACFT